MKRLILICIVAANLSVSAAERSYPVFPAATAIFLDGKLNEAAWSRAPTGTQFFPLDPALRAGPTEFRLLHVPQGLYLGLIAHEEETDALVAEKSDKEAVWAGDDSFEIFLSAAGGKRWIRFAANCRGKQYNTNSETAAATLPGEGYCLEMYIPFAALGYEAAPKRISGNICRNRFAGRKGSFHSWGLVEGSYKEQKHWAEMILLPEGARVPVDRLNRFINFCGHTTLLQNAVAREQRFTDLLTSASSIVGSDEHILSAWRIHVEQADSYMAFHRTIDRIMTASPRHSFAPVEPAEGICPDPRLFRFPISLSPAEEEFLVRIRLEQLLK